MSKDQFIVTSMKRNQKVYIVIAVFNRVQRTLSLIRSLTKQTYNNYEIILVDDGSTDNTEEMVREYYPEVVLIKGNGNWWWAGSVNRGIEYARIRCNIRDDYLLHVNNDVVIEDKNFLREIIEIQNKFPNSIVVPRTILRGSNIEYPVGVYFYWHKAKSFMVSELDVEDTGNYKEMDALFTKTILFPFRVFDEIGFLNASRYPQYQGDVDFTYRAHKKGFALIKANTISIHNFNSDSDSGIQFKNEISFYELLQTLFSIRSSQNIIKNIQFIMDHCPRKYRIRNSLYFTVKTIIGSMRKYWLLQKMHTLLRK